MKHTPGPWTHDEKDIKILNGMPCTAIKPIDDIPFPIAVIPGSPYLEGILAGNPSLIAAAPDLLAGCKDAIVALEILENSHGIDASETKGPIERAIAKAEGSPE